MRKRPTPRSKRHCAKFEFSETPRRNRQAAIGERKPLAASSHALTDEIVTHIWGPTQTMR